MLLFSFKCGLHEAPCSRTSYQPQIDTHEDGNNMEQGISSIVQLAILHLCFIVVHTVHILYKTLWHSERPVVCVTAQAFSSNPWQSSMFLHRASCSRCEAKVQLLDALTGSLILLHLSRQWFSCWQSVGSAARITSSIQGDGGYF